MGQPFQQHRLQRDSGELEVRGSRFEVRGSRFEVRGWGGPQCSTRRDFRNSNGRTRICINTGPFGGGSYIFTNGHRSVDAVDECARAVRPYRDFYRRCPVQSHWAR
ncbi:hypothetical protein B0I35DRAFT_261927 [Stachybotrys elegans]|uniref:Uncharacterized protein n=1 Tax=Stachybotrys elegans TaxID=80388 RepID=A0A8K0WPR0_9HYPO|nr:hypothetical protein B0I35DRAFT_261927 [Stachybotrys elegans]